MATILNTTTSKGAGNYVGETRKQLRDGFGVYNYSNKFFRYEGEWSKGKKHGHGKLLMADGSFYEGQFQDGEIQGHGFRRWTSSKNEYTGQFVKGEMNGHGVMKYGNGSRYEGEWMNNQREGEGRLYGKDNSLYEGSFHANKKHGKGKFTNSNGDVYEGGWVKDVYQGHGVMKYEDGTIYTGQWWGGEMHGEGSMIHASGLTCEGLWIGGRPAAEPVAIRIVGKPQQDVMQGRSFGFEVECITVDGERVQEDGRLLQVTGWVRIYGKKSSETSDTDEKLPTPFGFDIEPYYLTESLGDMSSDIILNGGLYAPSSVMSTRPLQCASPSESTLDVQVPLDNGSDNGDKEELTTESQHDLSNRMAVTSQASTTINTIIDKGMGELAEQPLPSPPSPVRTTQGRAIFENLYLPPLPTGMKSFSSLHEVETRPEHSTRRASLMRWKKAGSIINPNLLSNTPTINEGGGRRKKEVMADIVEKADPKIKKSKDMKRDEKTADDKLCKPGDYVVIVQDVTIPRFLDSRLQPAFIHIKVIPKKKDKSKIDIRRNWLERQEVRYTDSGRTDGSAT